MATLQMKYLDWDSEQLGERCGLIDVSTLSDIPADADLTDQIRRLIQHHSDCDFITLKLPVGCLGSVNAMVQMGALLIDSELTFLRKTGEKQVPLAVPDGCRLEFCSQVDSGAFAALAGDMRASRFFIDPGISEPAALGLWETSIVNHCNGFADRLLVAYDHENPCGMVALKRCDDARLYLHVVGVLKAYRKKGYGLMMLQEIIGHYVGAHDLLVETQAVNRAAQALYQKAGFRYHSLNYVLHYRRQEK
jgi:ribosomal protein S18 acetylase RimI-like enzyme